MNREEKFKALATLAGVRIPTKAKKKAKAQKVPQRTNREDFLKTRVSERIPAKR
jgi:hypothetical protein